jgi:DNA mismatch endonuclease (patch repair protein)
MQSNRRRDTSTERLMRSALHRRGLRFRVDRPIRVEGARPIRPDVVFSTARIAVFIDGCFWHGCPEHGTIPTTNRGYWLPKIEENRSRDRRHTSALEDGGWTVVRVWEHEDPAIVAERIAGLVGR